MSSLAFLPVNFADEKPTLRERRQRETRNAIWEAAIDLFADKGFEETTVDEIAGRAGVSRRSFFRYYESKNDLLAKPILTYLETIESAIEALPRGCSPAEALRSVARLLAPGPSTAPRVRKLMTMIAKTPAAREAQESRFGQMQCRVASAFRKRFRDEAVALLAANLTLSIIQLMYEAWHKRGKLNADDVVDRVCSAAQSLLR